MRKYIHMLIGLLVGFGLSATGAYATGAFDSSTPPVNTSTWANRPCKANSGDVPLTQNCYWNSTMGLTPATSGFFIRKLPNQPIICYLYVNQTENQDHCYSTTTSLSNWDDIFYETNDRAKRRH